MAGCAASSSLQTGVPGSPSPVAPTHKGSLETCGQVTPSTGQLRDVLQVRLAGPSELATGSVFHATVTVSLQPGTGRSSVFLSSGGPVLPVIARGTDVVGQYEGGVGGVGLSAAITASRPYRIPTESSVLLRGCPDRPVDTVDPDGSRKLLPPGHYTIYAYVADYSGNDASKYGVIWSQPLNITVTAKAK